MNGMIHGCDLNHRVVIVKRDKNVKEEAIAVIRRTAAQGMNPYLSQLRAIVSYLYFF